MTRITEFSDVGGQYIDKDHMPEGISSLDPKWKGKLAVYDPTVSSGGTMSLTGFVAIKGDDFLKKLIISGGTAFLLIQVAAHRPEFPGEVPSWRTTVGPSDPNTPSPSSPSQRPVPRLPCSLRITPERTSVR